jgi:aquaporin Z
MDARKLFAEFLGTALLVIFAVGVATETFGILLNGRPGGSGFTAGIVGTAFAFGLVVLALAYSIGPISGCHVNPAVTMGFLVSGRMQIGEAIGYWIVQFLGGIAGALVLWGVFSTGTVYSRSRDGLGANGYGKNSILGINAGGALLAEIILTFLFVLVVLGATSRIGSPGMAGLAIGLALTAVHLFGIPLTGTSVNPARSLGPALVVGSSALKQVWVFILAPLVGGALAALVYRFLFAADGTTAEADAAPAVQADLDVGPTTATP